MTTIDRTALAARIAEVSLLRGTFTLRSGRTSSFYLDKYLFSTQPDILRELGAMFAERLPEGTTRLAGAELGGIPLVTATAMASGLPCLFIRNQKKDYGTAKRMEGVIEPGDRIVVIEDIATSGGQSVEAVRTLREAGAEVTTVIVTVDRLADARANVEAENVAFDALFTLRDLGIEPE